MKRINPHDAVRRAADQKAQQDRHAKKKEILKAKRSKAHVKDVRAKSAAHQKLLEGMKESFKAAEKKYKEFDAVAGQEQEDDE